MKRLLSLTAISVPLMAPILLLLFKGKGNYNRGIKRGLFHKISL